MNMALIKKQLTNAVIIFLSILLSCSEKDEIKAPGSAETDSDGKELMRPDQQIRGAQILLYKGSLVTTDIRADYIEKYDKRDSALAWKLDVLFYNDRGELTSSLVADSGLVRESANWMVANGDVVVIGKEDSARLETQQLFYYGQSETIETDSFVTIYQRGDTLRGYGMKADRGLKRVKIKRQVSGTLQNTGEITR
nr:LPS export ABC transporter periplasmic protein LptC [candidate division Zixibacteria bacterium]